MGNKLIFWFPAQQRLLLKMPSHSAALRYSTAWQEDNQEAQRWCSQKAMNINKYLKPSLLEANYIEDFFPPSLIQDICSAFPRNLAAQNRKHLIWCHQTSPLSILFDSFYTCNFQCSVVFQSLIFISAIWHFPKAFEYFWDYRLLLLR